MGIKERLMTFIKSQGISRSEFERNRSLSNGYINNIRESMGVDQVENVLRAYPQLNRVWLLSGEGDMLNPSQGITQHQHGGSNNSQTVTLGQSDVSKFIELLQKKDEQIDRLLTLLENK